MDGFDRRLAELQNALSTAPESVREVLTYIHDSALRIQASLDQINVDLLPRNTVASAVCFDCGAKDIEVFHTAKGGDCHLCPDCFQLRLEIS